MGRNRKVILEDDGYCFVCGNKNHHGLHLKFRIDKKFMYTEFVPRKYHQGYKNIVHGGLIGLILDEIMAKLVWQKGKNVVTAEINTRLKNMARVGEKLFFKSWIEKETKRIIYTKAETKDKKGRIIAAASAKCVRV